MTNIVLHVGLHKTGTTFLQKDVFPRLDSVAVVRGWHTLRCLVTASRQRVALITDELLSGHPFHGKWLEEFAVNLSFIQATFGDPPVIIGFRRHDALVLSLYKQFLQEGAVEPVEHLFEPARDTGLIRVHELQFAHRLGILQERFSRIFIYTQEELREDFDGFFSDLAAFLGVPSAPCGKIRLTERNVGLQGVRQQRLLMRLNRMNHCWRRITGGRGLDSRFFRKWKLTPRALCQQAMARLPSPPMRLPSEVAQFLREHYADDWRCVEEQRLASRKRQPRRAACPQGARPGKGSVPLESSS